MKKFRTIATSAVAFAVLASSITGCSLVKKLDTDAVMDATESLCGYITDANYKKISKMVSDDIDEDDLAGIEEYCSMTSGEHSDLVNAYLDTASYEIDEDSIEQDKKSGDITVAVTFTVADYDDVEENIPYETMDDAKAAISGADDFEMEVEFTFVEADGDYLLADVDVVGDFYSYFMDGISVFEPVGPVASVADLSDIVEDALWWWADSDDTYTDTDEIDLELYITDEAYESDLESLINWVCEYNGVVICEGESIDAWITHYDVSDVDGFALEDDYYFPSGEYVITFYYEGQVVYSDSTTVTYTGTASGTTANGTSNYSFTDEALEALADTYAEEGYMIVPYDADELEEGGATEGFMAISPDMTTMIMAMICDDAQATLDYMLESAEATNVETNGDVTTFEADEGNFVAVITENILVITGTGLE